MAYELNAEAEKALADTPKIREFAERLIAIDGGKTFEAVRTYLQFKERISSLPDGEDRKKLVNLAANMMALLSAASNLDAEVIVKEAEELARIGIEEIKTSKRIFGDGPATVQ